MSLISILILLAASLLTAAVSGVFGMAGGLMLMGVLLLLMPAPAAMATHGALQIVANGSRAVLHRGQIVWRIVGVYFVGAVAALALLAGLVFTPSTAWVALGLAAVSFMVWLPGRLFGLDAQKPTHAALCGFAVTGLNLIAGVAGPLLDVFFVRTALTRHQIVATKAATQVIAHAAKIAFYGGALLRAAGGAGAPPWWAFALALPLAVLGTALGGQILDRMTDGGFLRWTKWIVTGIGLVYLSQAISLLVGPL